MREIKFRAWDKKGVMVFNPPLVEVCGEYKVMGAPDHVVLMQFTGLKDKNGTKIYEGDIVRDGWDSTNTGEVTFDGGSFNLGIGYVDYLEVQSKDCEIIGNIYENPELSK